MLPCSTQADCHGGAAKKAKTKRIKKGKDRTRRSDRDKTEVEIGTTAESSSPETQTVTEATPTQATSTGATKFVRLVRQDGRLGTRLVWGKELVLKPYLEYRSNGLHLMLQLG